ncbi:Serine/threonine protein kinase [Prosthecobacter debontii]|uniref:Serine/threonine protein kinase n=1 Tax=Prosthecobacter debontii TaxID=48467 RepID=A0A1T4XR73_9BACT|nr:serine/threonine-protein kinase [Prosthecobacter debontii]SKA91853.1 Serine/threonine protein kinase [Prosthecobacter debontii]
MRDSLLDSRASRSSSSLLEGLSAKALMAEIMEPTQADDSGLGAMPPLSPEELAPHFPQLEILECLGRGGMGVVYKARQKSLNRVVALKLLAPERAGDPQFAARFEKEAHALAALNHPHIVAVYDFGLAGGFYYLLMEFVDGMNLRQLLQSKRLTPREALRIVPPVCAALQSAHEHGIVHCDIKPENLLIAHDGSVKIADFGIAKMIGHATDRENVHEAGTPDYAAPEQTSGQADHRADIYSLGVVLYEMLTGERPTKTIEAPSKRVQVDIRIDEIVLRALEKQPELRFSTVADLRQSVESLIQPSAPPIPSAAYSKKKRIIVGVLTGCLVIAGMGYWTMGRSHPKRPRLPYEEVVDFDQGRINESFADNVLSGRSGYAISPLGLAGTSGLALAETLNSEGTLAYKRKSYDLARLASLEISCCFRRQAFAGATHSITLGLTENMAGHFSGVPGAAFLGLRLKVEGEVMRFQFICKEAQVGPPRSWLQPGEIHTEEDEWYGLRVVFNRVSPNIVRVTGELKAVDRHGREGDTVAYFLPRDFAEPIFPLREILENPETWVAIRAVGPGGVSRVDDFHIIARPLPSADPVALDQPR